MGGGGCSAKNLSSLGGSCAARFSNVVLVAILVVTVRSMRCR